MTTLTVWVYSVDSISPQLSANTKKAESRGSQATERGPSSPQPAVHSLPELTAESQLLNAYALLSNQAAVHCHWQSGHK